MWEEVVGICMIILCIRFNSSTGLKTQWRDEYEDDGNFNEFSKTIYDNKEKIFKLQQSAIVDVMEHYASEYVSELVEISPYNYDEIDNEEIMVYAPNGFYVVPI